MLNWLNNKNPEFWKKYISTFKVKPTKYVVFSLQSSKFNTSTDIILSISAVTVYRNKILVKNALETYIEYPELELENIDNEFFSNNKCQSISELAAIEQFLNYIENAILIGHRINQDIELINTILAKYDCGKLKNEALDIEIMFNKIKETSEKKYALDEMNNYFSMPVLVRNAVSVDTFSIAILFLKLKTILKIN